MRLQPPARKAAESFQWIHSLVVLYWLGSGNGLYAQISPGPLSQPHSELEGSDQCFQCHSQKKRVDANRCLACHTVLSERLELDLGFHATVREQGCERCHMEHHGTEFDLVSWQEGGPPADAHRLWGFELVGAHATLECRSCHKADLIGNDARLLAKKKDLDRTYFGLEESSCADCHRNPHRQQFEDRTCNECHQQGGWVPLGQFSHEKSRFPLRGRHRQVACDRCHEPEDSRISESRDRSVVQYVGLEFTACGSCHQDSHQGRLGSRCQQCHSEAGWRMTDRASFDHDRTRFALRGAHQKLGCEACHSTGFSKPMQRFSRCMDCHRDHHVGQFGHSGPQRDCSSCHTVESFQTASFGISEHQLSTYPLEGAHLAVACIACHTVLPTQTVRQLALAMRSGPVVSAKVPVHRYRFSDTQCTSCHESPHEEALSRFMQSDGCTTCHRLASWRSIQFDHERTDYSLTGAHSEPTCRECHTVEISGSRQDQLLFADLPEACESCHEDPHLDQFASGPSKGHCQSCHVTLSFSRLAFDHTRQSEFTLDGSHTRTACRTCHRPEQTGDRWVVRYRPLPTTCSGCHESATEGASR